MGEDRIGFFQGGEKFFWHSCIRFNFGEAVVEVDGVVKTVLWIDLSKNRTSSRRCEDCRDYLFLNYLRGDPRVYL